MREIFERRSIRKFTEKPITKEIIKKIIAAGMQAPTACDNRGYEFIVIDDGEVLQKLGSVSPWSSPITRCNIGIVVLGREKEGVADEFWQQDLGAVTQNILLEAKHFGIGSVWMGIAPITQTMEKVRQLLNIPPEVRPFSLIALGYPLQEKEAEDRYLEEKVHYNKY